jgi:hypothetical protein
MEDGRALDPAYVTRLFQTLRKGSGKPLPPLSFHGLRHCAASLMLASDADIAVVSKPPRPRIDLNHGRRVWSPGRDGCLGRCERGR